VRVVTEISHTRHSLAEWARFIRSQVHILILDPQLILQQALNLPDEHPVGSAAGAHFRNQGATRSVIQWLNKPQASDPVLLTLNTESGRHCRFSPTDSRLLTWAGGSDPCVILWDVDNGRQIARWPETRVGEPPFVLLEQGSYGVSLWSEGMLRLYDAESGAELRPLAKAPDEVRSFSVAPGGRRVAIGYDDGSVRLVDATSGAGPFALPSHEDSVKACLFLLEGRRLITMDKSRLRLFDVESSRMLLEEPDRDGWTFDSFYVSANEHWLALEEKNEEEGWTTLWETETGHGGLPVTGSGHPIYTKGLSPEGDRVLAIDFPRGEVTRAVLELWSVATNTKELTLHLGWLSPYPPVRFSADGRWLAAGRTLPLEPGDIEVWDIQSRSEERVAHFQGHSLWVTDLAFSFDGRTLASIDGSGVLRLWALPVDGKSTKADEQPRHPSEVEACAFVPHGRVLMSSCSEVQEVQHGQDGGSASKRVTVNAAEIRLWDAETGAPIQRIEAGQRQPNCFAFSPDTRHLAVSSSGWDEAIRIWDRSRMVAEADLAGQTSPVNGCRYTRDGRRIVSMCFSSARTRPEDNALKIWDPKAAVAVDTLIGHAGEIPDFHISANGRFAVASSLLEEGDFVGAGSRRLVPADLFVWDLEKRAKCASLEGCFRPAFSPDGQVVVAISEGDEWAVLWQFASSASPATRAVRSGVSGACFTPDGRELALALNDGTVALLDPASGRERLRLRRAGEEVSLGPFSSDGRYMVEKIPTMVRVWNLLSGEQVAAFPAPASLTRIAINLDITKLAIGDKLGGVSLLRVSGTQPGPAIVTAVRVWRFGPHASWRARFGFFSRGRKDTQPTAICPLCEAAFVPASDVLDAVASIAREAGLADDVAPSAALPRDAWDERRLLSSCQQCGAPLRFSPFIA
jgi:WD40 repeat protein